jgi:hypothetical protein
MFSTHATDSDEPISKKIIVWELIPELEGKMNEQYFEYNRQRPNPDV